MPFSQLWLLCHLPSGGAIEGSRAGLEVPTVSRVSISFHSVSFYSAVGHSIGVDGCMEGGMDVGYHIARTAGGRM